MYKQIEQGDVFELFFRVFVKVSKTILICVMCYKGKDVTCEVRVDLKVEVSYTHPFWHGTVCRCVTLEELSSR